jgi:hypothetical protein
MTDELHTEASRRQPSDVGAGGHAAEGRTEVRSHP